MPVTAQVLSRIDRKGELTVMSPSKPDPAARNEKALAADILGIRQHNAQTSAQSARSADDGHQPPRTKSSSICSAWEQVA